MGEMTAGSARRLRDHLLAQQPRHSVIVHPGVEHQVRRAMGMDVCLHPIGYIRDHVEHSPEEDIDRLCRLLGEPREQILGWLQGSWPRGSYDDETLLAMMVAVGYPLTMARRVVDSYRRRIVAGYRDITEDAWSMPGVSS